MAAGWDISASAASGISDAFTLNNNAGIYFHSSDAGITSKNEAGDVTPTAARSLQQAPNPQRESAQLQDFGSALAVPESGNTLLYIIGAGALLIVGIIFLRK